MSDILGAAAVLACSFFAGAAVYITLVEHPARMSCGPAIALAQWTPSYKRATVMQVFLAVLATAAGALRWLQTGGSGWLIGALCIFAVIPFTLVVILPTNGKLLEPGRDAGSPDTRRLLEVWGRLHAVRSALSVVASVIYLTVLAGP